MTESFPEFPGEAAPAPREFTADELAEARRQLAAQGEDLGPAEAAPDQAALGMTALAAGAEATEVDAAAMLAAIRELTAKVTALEQEKRLSQAPDVVKYTRALADHLGVKAVAHPVTQADPDHTWGHVPDAYHPAGSGVLGAVTALAAHADEAAETGRAGGMAAEVAAVERWVTRHARRFPHIDYSYILDLAGEAAEAVAKLAA